VPPEGLIAHWKLDEGNGTMAADSVGDNDALVYGAAWSDGLIGGALRFDGADDYVDCGVHVPEVMTLSLWTYPEPPFVTKTLAGEIGFSFYENNLRFEIRSSRRVWYSFADGATQQVYMYGVTSPNNNEWTHMAVTRDGAEAVLYVDGARDTSERYDFTPGACSSSLTVGGTWSGDNPFKGKIDDVRLYDRPLSDQEIEDLAQADQ
jgi:hypothetical protein